MVRRLFWASLYATIGLSLSLPHPCWAQSDDDESDEQSDSALDDSVEPTGRTDQREGDEAAEASEGSMDEAAAAAANLESEGEDEQFLSAVELTDEQLDQRIKTLDVYLEDLKRPTRTYFFGWVAIQTALVTGQSLYAAQADKASVRTNYIVGASVSGASLLRLLFTSFPGRYASRRYRQMPTDTRAQKELKLAAGENWLTSQAKSDALGISWTTHVAGAVVAAGSGIALAAAYEHNLRDGVTRTLLTLFVSELQIHTRPTRAMRFAKNYSNSPNSPQLTLAPMADRYAQGLSLVGRF